MHAVEMNHERMVFFNPIELPGELRREIVGGLSAEIRDDVRVIRPGGDEYRPSYVLCVSRTGPKHYEFIDRGQVDPTRLRIVDSAYRVIGTVEDLWKFLKLSGEFQAMAASAMGVESPDDWPEGWDR